MKSGTNGKFNIWHILNVSVQKGLTINIAICVSKEEMLEEQAFYSKLGD